MLHGATTLAADVKVLWGSQQNDHIYGSSRDDVLQGLGGNDVIYGYGGLDKVYGGAGDDLLSGEDWGYNRKDLLDAGSVSVMFLGVVEEQPGLFGTACLSLKVMRSVSARPPPSPRSANLPAGGVPAAAPWTVR